MKQENDKIVKIKTSGYNGSEPMKICPKCKSEKPLSGFGYRNMGDKQNNRIQIQAQCKKCR